MLNTLFSTSSIAAKGRGGGGSGGSISIDDNWDAPPLVKARMAFFIIFAIGFLVELVFILKNMRKLPNFTARIPFIIAAIVLFILVLVGLMSAVVLRISSEDVPYRVLYGLWSTIDFFLAIEVGFRPAAFLLLVHQRGKLLRNTQNKATNPIVSQFWKRILDWALVAVACLVFLTYFAIYTNETTNLENLSNKAFETYRKALLGFSHMITVMVILLAIDVFASLLMLYIAGSSAKAKDPVIGRLLFIAGPAFLIFGIQTMAFDIYFTKASSDYYTLYSDAYFGALFASVFLDGLCRLVVFAALISVMGLPAYLSSQPNYVAPNMGNVGYPVQPQGWQYQPQPYANPGMPYQYGQQYPQPQQYPQQFPQPYSVPSSVPTSVAPAQPQPLPS